MLKFMLGACFGVLVMALVSGGWDDDMGPSECVLAMMLIMFIIWFIMCVPGPCYMDSGYHADDMPYQMKD